MIQMRSKTIKLLKENIEQNFDIRFNYGILDVTLKAQAMKEKKNRQISLDGKSSCMKDINYQR